MHSEVTPITSMEYCGCDGEGCGEKQCGSSPQMKRVDIVTV